jgi:hypothetical protein
VLNYAKYFLLEESGYLNELASFNGLTANNESAFDVNYNAFTIDFMYRWVFMPGSEINIVWKNAVFNLKNDVDIAYWQDLSQLLQNSALNSFSFKLIYWLDAQRLQKDRNNLPR